METIFFPDVQPDALNVCQVWNAVPKINIAHDAHATIMCISNKSDNFVAMFSRFCESNFEHRISSKWLGVFMLRKLCGNREPYY